MLITDASIFVHERYVSVFSASRLTGYSCRMLRHLIETEELPAVREGKRRWKIRLHDLYHCLERRMLLDKLRTEKVVSALLSQMSLSRKALNFNLTQTEFSTIYSTGTKIATAHSLGSGAILKTKPSHGGHYEQDQEPVEVHQ